MFAVVNNYLERMFSRLFGIKLLSHGIKIESVLRVNERSKVYVAKAPVDEPEHVEHERTGS